MLDMDDCRTKHQVVDISNHFRVSLRSRCGNESSVFGVPKTVALNWDVGKSPSHGPEELQSPSLIAVDATLQQAHLAAATSGCRHFILNRGDLEVARLKHGTPRSKEWKAIPTYQNKSLTNTLPTTVFSAPPSHWLARPRHADVSPAQKLPGIALVLCPIQAKKLPSASNVA